MLVYVFWHRPGRDVDAAAYEAAQRSFHGALDTRSASFRLAALPFDSRPGYEDWYAVEDWQALGELNEAAVDAARRAPHDRAATMAADGWGSIYALARGPAVLPEGVEWLDKPRGEPSAEFIAGLTRGTVWQRQLALGPGPEFCLTAPESPDRVRIWP